jgi:catechol 2,3-dioxygenase-like lactoylglutathione lyase family enzyme
MSDPTATGITHIGTAAIHVDDQDKALDFYVGTLGFELRMDAPFGEGSRWIEVAPPGAMTTIALIQAHDDARAGIDTGLRLRTADAKADHAALADRGVDVDAEIMQWPGVPPMFSFRDPDQNILYIVESA